MSCERKSRRISAPHLAALLAAGSLWLVFAAPAGAQSPAVEGSGARATSPEGELVLGEVNPGGLTTQYLVEYGPASSEWCGSGPSLEALIAGTPGAAGLVVSAFDHPANGFWSKPPYSTKPTKLGFHDREAHPVSVELQGLVSGREYCAQLVAFNDSGSASGGRLLFTAGAPNVINSRFVAAANKLEAEVNPVGQPTEYQVLYAPIASEWCVSFGEQGTPAKLGALTPLGFSDDAYHPVAVSLTGLVGGSEYCAALYAANASGSTLGIQVSFTELPTVESVTPSSGPAGGASTVTIKGENLGAASAIHFGGAVAGIQSVAPEKIVVSTPAHEAASVDVTVTTSAGTSETSAADRYTYEAASGSEGGGSGATTPKTTPGTGGGPGPALGETEEVGVVSGTVTVKTRGSLSFARFKGGALPDGSEVDATHGVVIVTVLTPDGKAVSAELYGGRFRLHQDRSGETHFVLTLPLTGCKRGRLPRGAAAAVTSRRRRHRPKSRYLWVSEKGGRWGTNGRYVSTSVEGTSWRTLDECRRTEVLVTSGRVKVRNLVTHRTRTLGPGGHYVAHAKHRKHPRHH